LSVIYIALISVFHSLVYISSAEEKYSGCIASLLRVPSSVKRPSKGEVPLAENLPIAKPFFNIFYGCAINVNFQ
jgi:hypothetical protein